MALLDGEQVVQGLHPSVRSRPGVQEPGLFWSATSGGQIAHESMLARDRRWLTDVVDAPLRVLG